MAKENKEVVEETTEQLVEEVADEKTTQPRSEDGKFKSKFMSADDPTVTKVDLDAPPPLDKEEVVEEVKEEKEETKPV